MNSKGMFYTNVSDYETKEDMMNDFIALRMYDMAKDKEIERLKEDYMILQNASDEVEEEKDKEIERLNNIIKKVLFILEHMKDDRVGYEVCIDLLKGSDNCE